MTHEQELDEFASDYAYVFSACLDKVRWRIKESETYEKYKGLFMAKVANMESKESFPAYQRLKTQTLKN